MTDLDLRLTHKKDYEELVTWWKWFRFEPPAIDLLPNNMKDGIMITLGDQNICAGFVYRTTSGFCWVEFIVSNPLIKDRKVRKDALTLLIDSLSVFAKKTGAKVIYTSLKNESLINHYKSCGYVLGSKGCQEMIKIL